MQESSCNADTVGEGGEQGLMQISGDKCDGAPKGNCLDPVRALAHRVLMSQFAEIPLFELSYAFSRPIYECYADLNLP